MVATVQAQIKKELSEQRREGHRKNLMLHLRAAGLPIGGDEFKFHPTRKWRVDFVWWFTLLETKQEIKLALEVEGGAYQKKNTKGYGEGGGHRSITGFDANLIKYNELAVQGWRLIRVTPEQITLRRTEGIDWISAILNPIWG